MARHLTLWAAVAALALLGACRKDTASIQAYQLCSMPDDCTFSGKCGAGDIDTPVIDVSGDVAMWLAVEVHNQLPDNTDTESGRVNTHDAHFESYSLDYSSPRAGFLPASITDIPATGGTAQQLIPAGGTSVIGFEPFPYGVVHQLLTDGITAAGLDYDEVTVKATFKGRYEDGSDWEVPFEFPVRVCHDCVSPACTDPTQLPLAACPSLFQRPQGAPTCSKPTPTCLTLGTFCGSNPNVVNGLPDTLYVCAAAGVAPSNETDCAKGCNAAVSPNACNP